MRNLAVFLPTCISALLLLNGCYSSRTGLSAADVSKVSHPDTKMVVPQEEILANIVYTDASYTGGGFIGALVVAAVDQANASKANKLIEPVRDALAGYNFDVKVQNLPNHPDMPAWIRTNNVEILPELTTRQMDSLTDVRSNPLLLVDSHYSLSPFFNSMIGTFYVELYEAGTSEYPLYKAKFDIFDVYVDTTERFKSQNAEVLSNDPQRLSNSLDWILESFVDALVYDLALGPDLSKEPKPGKSLVGLYKTQPVFGKVFKREGNVYWARGSMDEFVIARGKTKEKSSVYSFLHELEPNVDNKSRAAERF